MNTFKYILGFFFFLLFLSEAALAHCENKFYAFYYYPVHEYENDRRIKIIFRNASNDPNWSMEVEYVPRGTPPTGQNTITIQFTQLYEEVELPLELDLAGVKHYDLYSCGERTGSFQKEHASVEINLDFEFEKNHLYYFPFRRIVPDGQYYDYPDFKDARIHIQSMVNEGYNKYFKTYLIDNYNTVNFQLSLSRFQGFALPDAKIKLEFDFKYGSDTRTAIYRLSNGYFERHSGTLLLGSTIHNNDFEWYHFEDIIDLSTAEPYSPNDVFDNTDFVTLDILSTISDYIPSIYGSIDNLKLSVIGNKEEICFGDTIKIGGQYVTEEGIYADTFLDISNNDSVVYTTVLFHSKLSFEQVGTYQVIANGDWEEYIWLSYNDGDILHIGKEFIAPGPGEYLLVANDGNCTDTTHCLLIQDIGLQEANSGALKVFPNPVRDFITINMETNQARELSLFDFIGRKLSTFKVPQDAYSFTIDIHSYTSGIYLLQIEYTNGNQVSTQIVIE